MQQRFLNPEKAGEYLGGVPDRTMRLYVRQGRIPAYRVGKRLIFHPEDLRKFAEDNRIMVEAEAG